MNVLKELGLSIYDFKSYKGFVRNKVSKVFLAGFLLMVIYYSLTMLVPFVKFQIKTGGITRLIEENIPDFELSNGTFRIEESFEYEEAGTWIYINTDTLFPEQYEIEDYISGYYQVMLIDSEKMIVKSKGETVQGNFSELELEFSRDKLLTYVSYAYMIAAVFMILAFISMTITFFYGVLVIALVGKIITSSMNYPLSFGQLYLMAVYSRTLPLMIKALTSFLPFSIPMLGMINVGLSILYIGLAVNKMKNQSFSAQAGCL